MKYFKAPLDYCQILSLLKSRGLLIKDEDKAITIPQIDISLRGNWIQSSNISKVKLYPQVCLIEYLIQNINLESKFKDKLIELLHSNPNIDIKAMGFPRYWESDPLWKF